MIAIVKKKLCYRYTQWAKNGKNSALCMQKSKFILKSGIEIRTFSLYNHCNDYFQKSLKKSAKSLGYNCHKI